MFIYYEDFKIGFVDFCNLSNILIISLELVIVDDCLLKKRKLIGGLGNVCFLKENGKRLCVCDDVEEINKV